MMSKRRIAMVIAGMLVGAPIGIAGVLGLAPGQEAPTEAALAPGIAAAEPSDAQANPGDSTIAETAPGSGYVIPARPRTLADATFPPLTSDAFPPSTDERPLDPAVVAYLDQRAANTLLADAGAAEPIFAGYDAQEHRMPPAQVAYFDQLEATRLAAAEQRAREASAAATIAPPDAMAGAVSSPAVDRIAENMRQ
jgi:hypothetical protein